MAEQDGVLVRMSIQLSPAQRRELVAIARVRQMSAATLMREVVREYLAREDVRQQESVAVAA